jgi:tetratricopeptide (TPR) repeat protein
MNHPEWSREAALDLAKMYDRDGDTLAAAAALAPMVQSSHSEPIALVQFVRGRWFGLQGDTAAALAAFEAVLSQPDNHKTSPAARHLAVIYDRAGNSRAAEWALRRAIQVSATEHDGHDEGHARVSLGDLLLQRQDVETARIEFRRAAEVGCAEVRPLAHYRLGRLDLAESDNMPAPRRRRRLAEQAVTHFQRALEDDDGDLAVNLRFNLGCAYELLDDIPAARHMHEAALAVAMPEQRGAVLFTFTEFLVRQKMWAEAGPLLDSLVDGATSDLAERARKLRDRLPG